MSSQSRSSFYDPHVGFISSKTPSRVWPTTAQAQAQDLTSPRRRRRPFGMRSQFSVVRAMVVLATSSALLGVMTTTLGYSVAASPIPQTSAPTSLDTSSSGLPDPSFHSFTPTLPAAAARAPHDETVSVPTGLEDRTDVDDIDTSIQIELSRDDPFREDDGGSSLPPTTEYGAGDRAHSQVLEGFSSTSDSLHHALNVNHSDHLIHVESRQERLQKDHVLLGFAYASVPSATVEKSGYVIDKETKDGKPSFLTHLEIPGLSLVPFANTFLYLLKECPKPKWALGIWDHDDNERGMPHDAHKINPTHFCAVFAQMIEGNSPGLGFNPDLNYQPDRSADIKNRNLVTFFYRQPPKTTTEAEQATTATEKTTTKEKKTSRFSKLKSMITKNENTPTTVSGTQNIPVIVSKTKNIPVMEFPISLAQRWQAYGACAPGEFVSCHVDVASGWKERKSNLHPTLRMKGSQLTRVLTNQSPSSSLS
ncbi:hypothetical protein FB446DRAFT_756774 [Lentinula raphanica]|nr:hypothetical protein FB446DRAFT_756774 [Lentinula raphanica]